MSAGVASTERKMFRNNIAVTYGGTENCHAQTRGVK
jgi:hypothetical protein